MNRKAVVIFCKVVKMWMIFVAIVSLSLSFYIAVRITFFRQEDMFSHALAAIAYWEKARDDTEKVTSILDRATESLSRPGPAEVERFFRTDLVEREKILSDAEATRAFRRLKAIHSSSIKLAAVVDVSDVSDIGDKSPVSHLGRRSDTVGKDCPEVISD